MPWSISVVVWVMHSLFWWPGPDVISFKRFFVIVYLVKTAPRTVCGKYLVIPWHIPVEVQEMESLFLWPRHDAIIYYQRFFSTFKNKSGPFRTDFM